MTDELEGFSYIFAPRSGPRTLLLLHGTGGNEEDMLDLGASLDPSAHLLSVRGQVQERGMNRFFKRFAEGVLDREDLAMRSEELARFIEAAKSAHGISSLIGVGFSNGANMLLHLACMRPEIFSAALLLRPMSDALPDSVGSLNALPFYIGAGRSDEYAPEGDAERLATVLMRAGAGVTLRITDASHRLTSKDIDLARGWLAELS